VISVDGSKIWADAAKEANRTLEGLRKLSRKVLEEAAAADGDCGCQGHGHGEAAGAGAGCGCCDGGMLPGLGLCGPAVLPQGWGGASRKERIAAALADLEAAREAEDAARREQAEAYLAKARAGQAPPGRIPQEAAVTVAEIALEQAAAAQQARRDAYDQRVAASAGRGVRGTRPARPEQAAPVRRCRERLAAARKAEAEKARAAQAAAAGAGESPPGGDGGAGKAKGKRDKKPPIAFVAGQRDRARRSLPELGIHRRDGRKTTARPGTAATIFDGARGVLRAGLESGACESLGLDRAFVTAIPHGGLTSGRRRPLSDEAAMALAAEVNLAALAARDEDGRGLRDIWETLIVTGRRSSEVRNLRLECLGGSVRNSV